MNAPLDMRNGAPGVIARMPPDIRALFEDRVEWRTQEALARQGMRAFGSTRRTAAAHEAGHAIVFAARGDTLESVRICPVRDRGRQHWIGVVKGAPNRPATWTIEDNLRIARANIAGVAGELLGCPDDYRAGSSIDEIVLAELIVGGAAVELGVGGRMLLAEQFAIVGECLDANRRAFDGLREALQRHCRLRGKGLARLLAGVTVQEHGA